MAAESAGVPPRHAPDDEQEAGPGAATRTSSRPARLTPEEAAEVLRRVDGIPSGRTRAVVRTHLGGTAPSGEAVVIELSARTLVVFLSVSCDGCGELAGVVRAGVPGMAVLGALRAPSSGLPSSVIDAFVGTAGTWLLGDDAFDAFEVRSAPFFCVVDEDGQVELEGVAFGEAHLREHCARLLAGVPVADAVRLRAPER